MTAIQTSFPEFSNPPLAEVVLTVQFEKIEGFRTVHAGLLWERLRRDLPNLEHVEEHAQVDQPMEFPGVTGFRSAELRVELVDLPQLPRLFFLTSDRTQLIQFQPDRLSHNWRKVGGAETYPHYENIRPAFEAELRLLETFLAERKLGALAPTQCEISYINHIVADGDSASEVALGRVSSFWPAEYRTLAGCEFEDVSLNMRHVIRDEHGEFLGRLVAMAKPALRRFDKKPLLVLELVARGRPMGEGISGALRFIDTGRERLRQAFDSLTSEEMHRIWGRSHGG